MMKIYISNKTDFRPTLQALILDPSRCCNNQLDQVELWDDAQFIWKNVIRGLEPKQLPKLEILNIFMTTHETLTEKRSLLSTGVRCMRDFFDVAPETRLSTQPMPDDGLWISKPAAGYGGNGIRIHRGPIRKNLFRSPHVIQRYIEHPLLMNNHKFDIRMFVLLTLDSVYYYKDGTVRICSDPYTSPNIDHGSTMDHASIKQIHITNVAQGNTDAGLDALDLVGVQVDKIYSFIKQLKPLFQHAQSVEKRYRHDNNIMFESFELLGLDIILDDTGHPWLLEINKDPAIPADGKFGSLAAQLLEDTLKQAVWFKLDPTKQCDTGFVEF